MISQYERLSDRENNNYIENCLVFCECLKIAIYIIILTYVFAYYIIEVVFLIKYWSIDHQCHSSHIWEYNLISLIFGLCRFIVIRIQKYELHISFPTILIGCIELSIAIWGGVELFIRSCDKMYGSALWILSLINFCAQLFTAVMILIILPFLIIRISRKHQLEVPHQLSATLV